LDDEKPRGYDGRASDADSTTQVAPDQKPPVFMLVGAKKTLRRQSVDPANDN
jgi:hypothetical protein